MTTDPDGGGLVLHADTDVCAGAGQCVRAAPELFDQDDDGLVVALTTGIPAASSARAREAVDLCPSGAIGVRVLSRPDGRENHIPPGP
ncbi:(4Fe-4S)-binding protein [Nocardiopsis sp. N85]|uniref:ferredoxin n=1 Tax=Nocardiopsis sp. N85 TaxID=3029400 RepID=UPI00237FC8BE|nr:(4Fe-4S)-binding protein [Nocardiopsis sp. N85]MDE3722946.1 (4Fe-4S)-binding protein [Nocardiopsis sp. N85]